METLSHCSNDLVVSACLAMSWDGKITAAGPANWTRLGSDADLARLFQCRDQADALIMGATTFRAWPHVRRGTDPDAPPPLICLMTQRWDLDWQAPMLTHWQKDWPPILIASALPPPAEKLPLPPWVDWLPLANDNDPMTQMNQLIQGLSEQGCRSVLVEGGGSIVARFVEGRALQRLYLTVTPWLIGGATTPTLMDGLGFQQKSAFPQVSITECQPFGSELFVTLDLHYPAE